MPLENEEADHIPHDRRHGKSEPFSIGERREVCVDERHFFAWLDADEGDNADGIDDWLTQLGSNAALVDLFRAMRRSRFDGATTVIDKHLLYEKVVSISLKMKTLELTGVKKV